VMSSSGRGCMRAHAPLGWRPVQQPSSHLLAWRSSSRVVSARAESSGVEPLHALVVGGGPAGFATALMLSRRGYRGVTVLEKVPWYGALMGCWGARLHAGSMLS
jgi:hypothetical protein